MYFTFHTRIFLNIPAVIAWQSVAHDQGPPVISNSHGATPGFAPPMVLPVPMGTSALVSLVAWEPPRPASIPMDVDLAVSAYSWTPMGREA